MSWLLLTACVHWLGILAYGSVLVVFSVLLPLGGRIKGLQPWHLDRAYRACGALAGLGLGAILAGGFGRYALLHGGFTWAWSTPHERLELAKHLVMGVLWVSYTLLEIWILEPLRRLDTANPPPEMGAYLAARPAVVRHVGFNLMLLVVILVLALASQNTP